MNLIRLLRRLGPLGGAWLAAVAVCCAADDALDTITLAPRPDDAGRIVVRGKVVDFTGALLTYDERGGERRNVPGRQVVDLQTTWHADYIAADAAWRRRDFASAATLYPSAFAAEQRRWVKRLIQSQYVACLRETDRWEQAAEAFFSLVREDPSTPYFETIPLPWTAVSPSPALEARAKLWMADRQSSVASLVGASLLPSTAARNEAARRLRELAGDADPRIARLAEAQTWRLEAVAADVNKISAWEQKLASIPDPLRPGPTLVVGRAWAGRGEAERAALQLLQLPILHADRQPRLAAEGLWSAGQMLERLTQTDRATDLYRELVRDYPNTAAAATARERLETLRRETASP